MIPRENFFFPHSNQFSFPCIYLQNENVVLKSSIEECTSTIQLVHSEMNGLKTIANDGVSKLRKREKKLLDEQRKDKDVIAEMEKKLEHANSLIHSLQLSSMGGMHSKPARQHSTPLHSEIDYHITPPRSAPSHRKFVAELSTEKELRYKAEEICAGVLANSKVALEERDSEISKLRSQLFRLSSKRQSEIDKRLYEL